MPNPLTEAELIALAEYWTKHHSTGRYGGPSAQTWPFPASQENFACWAGSRAAAIWQITEAGQKWLAGMEALRIEIQ